MTGQDTFEFQAEINQLMSLIINAFYSNKEIFLRELISNSSDALDKIRSELLTSQDALKDEYKLRIRLIPKKDDKQLWVEDTGIGMTREELIENLGTVARSGTKNFVQTLKDNTADLNMIGQFGVGFYSVFLVADKVDVYSKSPNSDKTYKWTSTGTNKFTVTETDNISRGTRLVIHLKDDQLDFLNENTLKDVINKYSKFISYPIELYVTKTKEVEIDEEHDDTVDDKDNDDKNNDDKNNDNKDDDDDNKDDDNKDDDKDDDADSNVSVEDLDDNKDKHKNTDKKTKKVEYNEFEKINTQVPIWTKNPSQVTKEEYAEFYKSLTNDHDEYADVLHFKVEGKLEFTCLLFVPKQAPYDLFQNKKEECDVKLYVRKVFITDKCNHLVPEYLKILRGIVDSNDLPLNVSREMLQENDIIKTMSTYITKRTIDMLNNMVERDEEEYLKFYKEFSKNVKLGVHEDNENRNKLLNLLRLYTTKHKDNGISLDKYIEEMKEDQKDIYYLSGESLKSLDNTPFLDKLHRKGYDAFLLVDPIDEYAIQQINEYFELIYKKLNMSEDQIKNQWHKDMLNVLYNVFYSSTADYNIFS